MTGHDLGGAARSLGRFVILRPGPTRLPLVAVAVLAAAWAAAAGLIAAALIVLLVTDGAPDPSTTGVLWLAAHHIPLQTDVGTVTLLPLGLLVLTVAPLRRAGRYLAAGVPGAHLRAAGIVALVAYVAAVLLIATLQRDLPTVTVPATVLWGTLTAAAAGSWGVVRQRRGGLPRPPFAVAVAVCAGVPLLLGVLLTGIAIVLGRDEIIVAQAALANSVGDQVALFLTQLAYLPNLVIWAGAFAIGAGFQLNDGHTLSPFASSQPVVPDFPILTAVPAAVPNATALLPIVVALGGVLSAVIFARLLPEPRLRRRITRAVALSLTTGAIWWVLGALSGGSLGDGRLQSVGPAPGTVVLVTLLTAAGSLLWALLPTLASDARPVAIDLRDRVSTAAAAAKDSAAAAKESTKDLRRPSSRRR